MWCFTGSSHNAFLLPTVHFFFPQCISSHNAFLLPTVHFFFPQCISSSHNAFLPTMHFFPQCISSSHSAFFPQCISSSHNALLPTMHFFPQCISSSHSAFLLSTMHFFLFFSEFWQLSALWVIVVKLHTKGHSIVLFFYVDFEVLDSQNYNPMTAFPGVGCSHIDNAYVPGFLGVSLYIAGMLF